MQSVVRELRAEDVAACESLLAGLPDWFGLEETNREYIGGLLARPSAVAEADGAIAGFLSIEQHNPRSAEVHVMAVDAALHRTGVGSALLAWAERWCRENGVPWLHVKTRGPSTPDPGYEKTRHFYLASGFEPLFETRDLWGPEDAALILVKTLPERDPPDAPA
ncbi:MAG: GNAT family N-acetyltransferase [Deltaproteobacteria bacterium]|nr:GNAT family N-acetyltransferase [Deltaproteobacteria bacterium]